jgi:hypothetical protein
MKTAQQHSYSGSGQRLVRVTLTEPSGYGTLRQIVSQIDYPAADKAEALAIAKREGAAFIA